MLLHGMCTASIRLQMVGLSLVASGPLATHIEQFNSYNLIVPVRKRQYLAPTVPPVIRREKKIRIAMVKCNCAFTGKQDKSMISHEGYIGAHPKTRDGSHEQQKAPIASAHCAHNLTTRNSH